MENSNPNPLAAYYRQPKIYVQLPSRGQFYAEGALDVSRDGQYPVYAMTAKDELMYKTPDALASGQSTVEIIKSCIPAIEDPWQMPSIDVDVCLIAIRVATYGENMDISSTCPSCNTYNDYEVNISNYLEYMSTFEYNSVINVGELTVHIRPYTYKEVTQAQLKTIEQEKIFSVLNDEKMPDDEKLARFGDSFSKLTQLTVDIISDCVAAIQTPEATVTDSLQIKQFINNAPKDVFEKISNHVHEIKKQFDFPATDVNCTECQHHYKLNVTLDQADFFAVGS